MSMRYYELIDNLEFPGRWHVRGLVDRAGVEYDERCFTYGLEVVTRPHLKLPLDFDGSFGNAQLPLSVFLSRDGLPLDFTFSDSDMPVIGKRVEQLVKEACNEDIQLFPVTVAGTKEQYYVLNVVSLIDCIDKDLSEIEWFQEGNEVRPDLAGKPESISRLVIDPSRTNRRNIFRLKDWDIPVIVSELVKECFEAAKITGVRFRACLKTSHPQVGDV